MIGSNPWPCWHCPVHGAALDAGMRCPQGHSIPVVGGIPRFVGDDNYAAHFGEQWKRYRLTQLDSYIGKPISHDRVRRCFGKLWPLVANSCVLECGCGAGRFTEVLLGEGARVASVDLSQAVEAHLETFPINDRHLLAQADILALPFAPRAFDFVVCLGVIQHTPSPERTIAALYEQVRPGGWLILDHYAFDYRWYTKTAPLFRAVLKRMRPERSLRITERLVNALLPLHRATAHRPLQRAIVSRISPVLTHYITYPELGDELQRQWALLDTHDALTDWYKHFRSREQIQQTLEGLGARNIECAYGGNGVEARAQREQ